MNRRLVINADDFGLTPGVCTGILRAGEHGVVTSTSALAVAPSFARFGPSLASSGLPVGLHVCAVGEDPPLLTPREIPTLVDRKGRFPLTWKTFVAKATRHGLDPADLSREFDAQLAALRSHGISPTHVDAHQNLHLWPEFGTVVLDLARRHGITGLRVPGSGRRTPLALGVRAAASRLRRRGRRAGLIVADRASGLDDAGRLGPDRLRPVLQRLVGASGVLDLAVHPGLPHDPPRQRYRWGYGWGDELAALLDPELRTWLEAERIELVSYRDLARDQCRSR